MTKKHRKSLQKKTPVWVWAGLGLIGLIVVGFTTFQFLNRSNAPDPAEITVAQAAQKRDRGAFILDVRQPEEWAQFHIPGATLIPLGELPNRLGEIPRQKEVIVVCRTGHRSAQGRDILLRAGFTEVTSLAGGVTEWQNQGLPIAAGQ